MIVIEEAWPGVAVIAAATAVGIGGALAWRAGRPAILADILVALAGAGVAAGGLVLQVDVGLASWVLAPPLLAALAVGHVRALFARGGPWRT